MSWTQRVEAYLNELEATASKIDLILDETRIQTIGAEAQGVSESTLQLQAALSDLENKIAQREKLLRDPDAPPVGLTLNEKLLSSMSVDDARLAKRCRDVAETIEMAHTRAVSLFVCQFHLSDLTTSLVQTLTGTTAPPTYQGSKRDNPKPQGGGLFDKAA